MQLRMVKSNVLNKYIVISLKDQVIRVFERANLIYGQMSLDD